VRTALWDVYARCYDSIARLQPYQDMVLEVVGEVPENAARVLDAGCGTGNLTRALNARQPGEVVAADLSAMMLDRARRKNPDAVHIRVDLDRDLDGIPGQFDAIVCGNVVYALDDPARAIARLRDRLTPGGRLIVTTPRRGARTGPILRDHIRARGVLSLLPIILPLLVVGAINARLLRTSSYHFLTREELNTDDIRETYSGQAWLALYPPRPPSRDRDEPR
jgi:SAM-dependent methyltransferase